MTHPAANVLPRAFRGAADRRRPSWSPPRPGGVWELPEEPWALAVRGPGGHRFVLDVFVAALEDERMARALNAAILDGLCPTCTPPWRVRALVQRHVLPAANDRAPALRFRHADACPACDRTTPNPRGER